MLDRLDRARPEPRRRTQQLLHRARGRTTWPRSGPPAPIRASPGLRPGQRRRSGVPGHVRGRGADRRRLGAGGRGRCGTGACEHAVNIAGGLHHAMRGYGGRVLRLQRRRARRSATLLAAGAQQGRLRRHRRPPRRRRAGRVLRRPAGADDQPAPGPAHAVPRHRAADRDRRRAPREGTAVNVALPPGTGDDGWLRAFRRGGARRGARVRARTCWSPSAAATPTTRTRWPTSS